MTEESADKSLEKISRRPFFLSILCIAIFVYSGFLSIIFLFAILFKEWVTNTMLDFFPEKTFTSAYILFFSAIGFLITSTSFIGGYFLWKLKKIGFYLYLTSNLIFIFLPFFIGDGNLYSAAILIIILLLILIFIKKLK